MSKTEAEDIKDPEESLENLLNKLEIQRIVEKWKDYYKEGLPFAVNTEDYIKRVVDVVNHTMREIEMEIDVSADWSNIGEKDQEFLLHFVP